MELYLLGKWQLLSDSRGDKRKFERDLHKFHYQE
jgi:hypothetical protein